METVTHPTRLFLVRHGEVAPEWRGRVYGDREVPLSPRGEEQARAAARRLREEDLAAVISSGLARAEFGAAALRAGRSLARRDEPALRELARGAWVGLRVEDVPGGAWAAWLRHPATRRPPGGESLTDLAHRVLPRLDALAREFEGGALALVVHSWVIRVAICATLGVPLDHAPRFATPPGAVTILDRSPGGGGARGSVLAALAADRPPARGGSWYRGPARA